MHITILALGSHGDILPYLTLGKGLRQVGHNVRFATFKNFKLLVEARDLNFYPIHGDAQALVNQGGTRMLSLARSFASLGTSYARDLSDPRLLDTDLIINQLPAGLFGYDLAQKAGIDMLLAAVIPLTRTSAFPAMGFPNLRLPGFNRLSYRMAEQLAWQMMRRPVNRWRREFLGLPSHPLSGYFKELNSDRFPVLYGLTEHVLPRPLDWGDHVHITGYWFPEDNNWRPPDDLNKFIASGPPPIFIGFGSMPVADTKNTTRLILDVLRQSGQRAILHRGWAGLGDGGLPDQIFVIDYAPYGWLFPQMSLVIHHGGSGTTGFGLRAGSPSLVIPFTFDQFFWAKRVKELGVGPDPFPFRQLSSERLTKAIRSTIGNDDVKSRSAALGRRIQSEDGMMAALEIIQQKVKITSNGRD